MGGTQCFLLVTVKAMCPVAAAVGPGVPHTMVAFPEEGILSLVFSIATADLFK